MLAGPVLPPETLGVSHFLSCSSMWLLPAFLGLWPPHSSICLCSHNAFFSFVCGISSYSIWNHSCWPPHHQTRLNYSFRSLGNGISFLFSFLKIMFNWRIIALQYCVGFCQTSTWINHRYTYVPTLLNLLTPLGCFRALVWVPWVIQQIWKWNLNQSVRKHLSTLVGNLPYRCLPFTEGKSFCSKWPACVLALYSFLLCSLLPVEVLHFAQFHGAPFCLLDWILPDLNHMLLK